MRWVNGFLFFGRVFLPFDVAPQASSLLRVSSESVDLSPGSDLSNPPCDVGISALLESCSSAPAEPRPLFSSTHSKFVLGQCDIAEAAGCIGTGPNCLQRLYNGRCEQLVAPDGLKSAAESPYSR